MFPAKFTDPLVCPNCSRLVFLITPEKKRNTRLVCVLSLPCPVHNFTLDWILCGLGFSPQEELIQLSIPSLSFIIFLGSKKTLFKKAPGVPQHGWREGDRALGSNRKPETVHVQTSHAAILQL